MKTVKYSEGQLNISINTTCPAATHARLMQSIISSVRYSVQHPDKQDNFGVEITPLLELMQQILPDEQALSKE